MKKTVDDIFKNSEHEKVLEIRPELWDKMERTLSNEPSIKKKTPLFRRLLFAASLAFIIASSYAIAISLNDYQLEDLTPTEASNFTKEEIVSIDEQLAIKRTIIPNPNPTPISRV